MYINQQVADPVAQALSNSVMLTSYTICLFTFFMFHNVPGMISPNSRLNQCNFSVNFC